MTKNAGAAGALLGDRFELEQKLGQGGMATVYRARDRSTGATVAVKVTASTADARRFAREAELLARTRHPAIVRYLTHGRTSLGERFLVMEWVEGESLRAILRARALGIGEALVLARRMANALVAVHAHGLLHRDIKPSNIMVPSSGVDNAKLIDFGIALAAEGLTRLTAPGCVVGTWAYMAPERARQEGPVDERADLYSLGCVLYEALTRTRPFPGAEVAEVIRRILWEVPPPARVLRADIPAALEGLLGELLAKAPTERPASAAAVLERLEAVVAPEDDGMRQPAVRPGAMNAALAGMVPSPGSTRSREVDDADGTQSWSAPRPGRD